MKPVIKYMYKERMYPDFGHAFPSRNEIWIRADLPDIVQDFVKYHEIYHLTDTSTNVFWREIKANVYGGYKNPAGLILAIIMTIFSWDRWKLYYKRLKEGK